MLLETFFILFLMQSFCQPGMALNVDTSQPATAIGLYLKSLVRSELSFEHLQSLSNAQGEKRKTNYPIDVQEIIANSAKKLDSKMTLLQDYLTNITNKLSVSCFQAKNLSKEKKLPQPCCSSNRDMIVGRGKYMSQKSFPAWVSNFEISSPNK